MKGDVDRGVFVKVVEHLLLSPETLEKPTGRDDGFIARVKGDQARRHALERRPGLDRFDDLALCPAHHHDAATRSDPNEALLLQHSHGFADGRATHTETLRQLAFVEHQWLRLAIDVEIRNRLPQSRIGLARTARFRGNTSQYKVAALSNRRWPHRHGPTLSQA